MKVIMHIMFKFSKIFILIGIFAIIIQGCSSSESQITSDDPDEAFRQAMRSYERRDYLQAVEDFSFLQTKFQGKSIIPAVKFYLAQSYYYAEEYILAEEEYRRYIENYSKSEFAEEALYMLGMTYYRLSPKYSLDQEFTTSAIWVFQTYMDKFPSGRFIDEVNRRSGELKDKLAYKIYKSGELYVKMDKYRAAATSFSQVLDLYIDSQWADDAMVGLIESYIALDRKEDARKEIDRFYLLFSSSTLKSRVDRLNTSL